MIGVFDSGVGGMTVARAIEEALPDYPLIYFGDTARSPYGPKSPEKIIQYSRENTGFLLARGARLIVIACNSAASVASDLIRAEFDVPVFEVITPAVRQAIAVTANGRIGVIGTRATVRSGVYEKMIAAAAPGVRVESSPCPLLVPLVEEGWLDRRETKMVVRRYLHPLKLKQIDTLVLGCTHYPLLRAIIQPRIGKKVRVIDSAAAVAAELRTFIEENPDIGVDSVAGRGNRYYVSDVTDTGLKIAAKIFGRKINLELADDNL
ncbi:MAG: glutamate racemase [Desulfurivibrionaceae bacterium]|nr:glutamate racemase [Desulfobulbales bacterium]MDT8334301.1 glutamate racemase [Desulfurivibrionaceae bacterium]